MRVFADRQLNRQTHKHTQSPLTLFHLFLFLLFRQNLEDALSVMPHASHVEILLPKFTLRMRSGLKSHLQALGLKSMFDSSANFTGMARATGGRHLVVSDAQQEAVIEVRQNDF